jgi:hypothetical protein
VPKRDGARTTTGPACRPFSRWRNVGDIAVGFRRDLVATVLRDEAARGRVELDGGRVRVVRSAFAPDILAAFAALD